MRRERGRASQRGFRGSPAAPTLTGTPASIVTTSGASHRYTGGWARQCSDLHTNYRVKVPAQASITAHLVTCGWRNVDLHRVWRSGEQAREFTPGPLQDGP